jgi:hypothetical protein
MNVTAPLFAPIASGEARAWTPPQGRADIAPPAMSASKATAIWLSTCIGVVPALLRSAPIEGRVLEPAAGPFPDDGSPTRKRASSQRRDALWADPPHQALTQEDDANDDPIPPAR